MNQNIQQCILKVKSNQSVQIIMTAIYAYKVLYGLIIETSKIPPHLACCRPPWSRRTVYCGFGSGPRVSRRVKMPSAPGSLAAGTRRTLAWTDQPLPTNIPIWLSVRTFPLGNFHWENSVEIYPNLSGNFQRVTKFPTSTLYRSKY